MVEILCVALLGLAAGFINAYSTGGGMLSVPALMLLGVPPVAAIATSRLGTVAAAFSSAIRYYRGGVIDWRYMPFFLILAVTAGIVGPHIVLGMPHEGLEKGIAIVMLALLPIMVFQKHIGTVSRRTPRHWKMVGLALLFLVLLYSTMVGAGAGILFLYVLVYLFGMKVVEANATCTIPALVGSLVALVTYVYDGDVIFRLAIPLSLGALVGGYIGAHAALKSGSHWVKWVLVVIILLSSAELLLR